MAIWNQLTILKPPIKEQLIHSIPQESTKAALLADFCPHKN